VESFWAGALRDMKYQPPYTITPAIVNLVAEIGETIGRYTVLAEQNLTPRLRRETRFVPSRPRWPLRTTRSPWSR